MDLFEQSPRSTILSGDLHSVPHLVSEETDGAVVSLEDFIRDVPAVIKERQVHEIPAGSEEDPIQRLFARLHLERSDWEKYAHSDPQKQYTRNLVATDGKTYTLLVLCWNGESPIHDHPCDGCWARVLEGSVRECRYKSDPDSESEKLVCTQEMTMEKGDGIMFIEDSMGYHKVGCPSPNQTAVTMHLYSPPFKSCKIFLNEDRKSCEANVCFYSMYGEKVHCGGLA